MMLDNIPSKTVAKAVEQLSSLPSIGGKTALRLVLKMLRWDKEQIEAFGQAFIDLSNNISYCENCYNLSDSKICDICANPRRNAEQLCIVESVKDVLAIEATQQYKGHYFVLGGLIAPLEGIGPGDLNIEALLEKLENKTVSEVILALNSNMEGETTSYYLHKKLKERCSDISTLARGISFGDELEFADEISLGKSILNRTPYQSQ